MTARILHPQLTVNIFQPAETFSSHFISLPLGKREREKVTVFAEK
jgi:hypothetical protein